MHLSPQVQSESDKAEEVKERARKARDTPFMEDAMESPGRYCSD